MINREDFNGKKYEEMLEVMNTEFEQYKKTIGDFTTIDECLAEEQILMASMQEAEDRLKSVNYALSDGITYEGKKYSKKEITSAIVYFLNKLEVKWETTLGLYQLVKIWKNESINEISYSTYDSTLRCLNQVTFKGFSEWESILAVFEYLSECKNEYSLDTGSLVYISECHNALMDRMKELDENTDVPESLKE